METFEVKHPLTGEIFEVRANSQNEAAAAILNDAGAKPPPRLDMQMPTGSPVIPPQFQNALPSQNSIAQAAQETGPVNAALISAGRTASRLVSGAQDVVDLANLGSPEAQTRRASRAATEADNTRYFDPLAKERPISTALGGMLPYMAAPIVGGAAGNVGIPALMGAAEYGTPAERFKRAGMAAAGGMVANAIPRLVGGRPRGTGNEYLDDVMKRGEELGFIPLPSEVTRSRAAQIREAKIESDPRTTEYISNIYEHNTRKLTGIAAESIGLPPGTDRLSPDLLNKAQQEIGQRFESAASNVEVELGKDFIQKLADINNRFIRGAGRRANSVSNAVDDLAKMAEKGPLSAQEYLTQTSTLAADARGFRASGNNGAAEAYESMRAALDQAFDAGAGNLKGLKEARNQWRTLLSVKEATDEAGDVSFARLSQKFKKDDFGYKRGNTESALYDAVRFFKSFPKNFGRSGTAERRPIPSMLGSAKDAAVAGMATGGTLGQLLGGNWASGAAIGGVLGGATGAAKHLYAPQMARIYLNPELNAGLLPMSAAQQRLLGEGLGAGAMGLLSPSFQSSRSK